MLLETLKELSVTPFEFRIFGKGLLYKVDMVAHLEQDNGRIRFQASGDIRFGVLKSAGRFESSYTLENDEAEFLSHSIEFRKVNFKESYNKTNSGLMFQKGQGEEKPVEVINQVLFDPLPLVFKLLTLSNQEQTDFSGFLLVGGKQKPFHFVQKKESILVEIDSKKLFEGKVTKNQVELSIPKLKVNLHLIKN